MTRARPAILRRLGELARFAASSLAMLGLKLLLMRFFLLFNGELLAYCLVLLLLYPASYLMHSRVTFGTRFGWRSFWEFVKTVTVFQGLDYLIFAVVFTRFHIESTYVILIATGIVFLLRFYFVRRSLRQPRAGGPPR